MVRQRWGQRLKEDPEIFSGIVWTGEKSIDLGLADAIGSAEYVAREIIKAEHIVDYTNGKDLQSAWRNALVGWWRRR